MIVLNRTALSFGQRSTVGGRTLFFRALFTLAALASSLYPRVASAGLVIEVENASAQAGGTGSFDVVLAATSGTFDVSAFSVELSVAAGSGVTFTGASVDTTTAPYLFTTLQEPPLTFDSFPTNDFTASDSDMTSPGFVTLSGPPTTTFGVENVTFAVAPGTPAGPVAVSIVIGNNTQILDLTGDILPTTAVNGTITIGASAVPEPSSLIMGLSSVGLISGVVVMKRRRP
jgi:hypothetical protein